MMAQRNVTVITATRNLIRSGRSAMFEQCLRSVREQKGVTVEHLVMDGASSDGTAAILEHYRRRGWIRFWSEPDKGLYDAMNKGLALASGEYTAFLGSDDFYHDAAWLRLSVRSLTASGAHCSSAPVLAMDAAGRCRPDHIPLWEDMFIKMTVNHQSLLMRTDTLRELGGFCLRYPVQADYHLLLRFLLSGGRYLVLPFAGCTFRNYGFASRQDWASVIRERLNIQYEVLRMLGAEFRDCVEACDLCHVPQKVFSRIDEHLARLHRPAFERRQKQTGWKALRRRLWTFSRRPGQEVFRLLGIRLWDNRFPSTFIAEDENADTPVSKR